MKNIAETESNRVEAETGIPEEVQLLVDALDDKRAVDIAVLDLRETSDTLDWFIIASGDYKMDNPQRMH